jgi:hypothetical protein
VTYPDMPAVTGDSRIVRSLAWPEGGALSASVAQWACDEQGSFPKATPAGDLLTAGDDDALSPAGDRDYDVQPGHGVVARLTDPVPNPPTETLVLRAPGGRDVRVATGVTSAVVRP